MSAYNKFSSVVNYSEPGRFGFWECTTTLRNSESLGRLVERQNVILR